MRVVAVICEYDPFHEGHAYHLAQARARAGADYVLCLMSCAFTQRGRPALFSCYARAEAALRCGADAVLGMPYLSSAACADVFAARNIEALRALPCVTHVSFGCETDDPNALRSIAEEPQGEVFRQVFKACLDKGQSVARARASALLSAGTPLDVRKPNDILAVCYLRALKAQNADIIPVPVQRITDYHSAEASATPSASAMRAAFARGDWRALQKGMPDAAYDIVCREAMNGRVHRADALDMLLLDTLRTLPAESLRMLPEIGEGLEMRIKKAAMQASTREALLKLVKTKRYTRARLERALTHALVLRGESAESPHYARLLGFLQSASPLMRALKGGQLPLIEKPSRLCQTDLRADELWALGAGLPMADAYRRAPVILP